MWKNQEEIVKTYDDHLESVKDWGGPADLDDIRLIKAKELAAYLDKD